MLRLVKELRYSGRALIAAPAFTLAVVITLAVGLGANIAVFSVVRAVLLRPLPYTEPEQLTAIAYRTRDLKSVGGVPSPLLLSWRGQSRKFDGLAAFNLADVTMVTPAGEQVRLSSASISSNLFSVLGVDPPAVGRGFGPEDDQAGAPAVAILTSSFWRRRFGGRPEIVGESLQINNRLYVVVGVTAASFRFPGYETPDVLVPLSIPPASPVVKFLSGVIGRLGHGSTTAQAESELYEIAARDKATYPVAMAPVLAAGGEAHVVPLQQHIVGNLRSVLAVALGAAGCVLLLASTNVANLLLARVTSREGELGIRAALGASPGRIVQGLITESLLLVAFGAGAALLTLQALMTGLRGLLLTTVPHPETIAIDRWVLGFGGVTAALMGLLCTVLSVSHVLGGHLLAAFQDVSRGRVRGPIRSSVRQLLVTSQVAMTLVLLVLALLLVNSLSRLTDVVLGFRPDGVLTMRVSAVGFRKDRAASMVEMLDRIRAVRGVASAGAATVFPLGGHGFGFTIALDGEPRPPSGAPPTAVDLVSPGYFQTMGVGLVAGRHFDSRDDPDAPPVAMVNRTFARERFGARDPVGRRLSLGGGPEDATITIVGVVDDVHDGNLGEPARAAVYRPFGQAAPQMAWHTAAVAVRGPADPVVLAEPVRRTIAGLAPQSAVYDVRLMADRLAASVAPERQRAVLFGLFALAAAVLTGVGLYGLLAYAVAQDRHEFGVRLALGSSRTQLVSLVVRRGLWPAGAGVVVGLGGAVALTRVLGGLLYGVTPTDLRTFAMATVSVLVIALLASVLPARRAFKADPLAVLRAE